MTTVYLIRHGETDWNMQGRWQGHVDVPLNEIGYRQARLLANRLARDGVRFEAIYSSDLARAYQTAWEIGTVLKVPVQLLPALREIDTGRWSGLTTDEVRTQFPDEWEQIMQGHDLPRGGGETIAALQRRVVMAVRGDGRTASWSHTGFRDARWLYSGLVGARRESDRVGVRQLSPYRQYFGFDPRNRL